LLEVAEQPLVESPLQTLGERNLLRRRRFSEASRILAEAVENAVRQKARFAFSPSSWVRLLIREPLRKFGIPVLGMVDLIAGREP
jgi:hypothetical protein